MGFSFIGIPHLAVDVDVAGGGLGIDFPVMAAERFKEGEPLRNAGVVQKVIERALDQVGIAATAAENFSDGGRVSLDRLPVECVERGDDRRKIIEQAPVVVGSGISGFPFAHGCGGRDRPFRVC
jgi:hypothetical protein